MSSLSHAHAFLTIFLLCVPTNEARCSLMRKECVRVHKKYEITDVTRCIKLLSTDLNATKATNLLNLTTAALALGERTTHQIVLRINATLASGKLSSELKSIITEIRNQMISVKLGFHLAHGTVKELGEFDDAYYDVSTMTDKFEIAEIWINKAKCMIDPSFYQSSIDVLSALRNIGLVLIDDADPHIEE